MSDSARQPTAPPILDEFRRRARRLNYRVALPEAEDPRVLQAAARAVKEGVCRPVLVGCKEKVERSAKAAGVSLEGVQLRDPATDLRFEPWLADWCENRREPEDVLRQWLHDPLYFADMLVRRGEADGAVMGAVATTGETLRAALRVIGVDPRYKVVTSCFLMAWAERVLVYADCGVVPRPTPDQLADIAMQAAEARRALVGDEPKVALLSFSTLGSAHHQSLEGVRQALEILRSRAVDFEFDGELQGDAALVPSVAERKAAQSPVAGSANVLIFPDLNSGNIAYKLTERLAGARAIGPLLQGLAKPIHDLSRGCSASDVLDTLAITALDAARERGRNKL